MMSIRLRFSSLMDIGKLVPLNGDISMSNVLVL